MLTTAFLIVLVIAFAGPVLAQFGTPQYATALASAGYTTNNTLSSQVLSPIYSTAFNQNQNATGFAAPLLSFSSLGFVYGSIITVMQSFILVPKLIVNVFSVALTSIGIPGPVATLIPGLMITFMVTAAIMVGVSAWMKSDLLNLGTGI